MLYEVITSIRIKPRLPRTSRTGTPPARSPRDIRRPVNPTQQSPPSQEARSARITSYNVCYTKLLRASLVPTKTGAAKAVGLVLPELDGRLDGVAMRVPTPNVSAVDLKFTAARETSAEEINARMRAAADGSMKGILGYTDEKLVSIDFNHDPHSAVFHTEQTRVMGGQFCRVLAWYDNEWGFSNLMVDLATAIGEVMTDA